MQSDKPKVLLLGMVYSNEMNPLTGQMFRDRVRCEALEELGYEVKTLDDKHDGDLERITVGKLSSENDSEFAKIGKHCRANFANKRRLLKSIADSWGEITFQHVILDYFFCPAGYVNMRWAENFFKETIPALYEKNILSINGSIWLPHAYYVEEMLSKFSDEISRYFNCSLVSEYASCPLYLATEHVEDQLEQCPDKRTNQNQILPLQEVSREIFYELKPKDLNSDPLMTPSKKRTRNVSKDISPLTTIKRRALVQDFNSSK